MLGSWIRFLRSRFRLFRSVGIWFHSGYSVTNLARTSRVMQLVPERAELVIAALDQDGLIEPGDVHIAAPASFEDLCRVHGAAYLEATTHAETLTHIFGLAPQFLDVDEILAAQRLAVGGTMAAAAAAANGHIDIAFNLGGGFHHADSDRGGGFCVYNDVAAAIALLRARGFDQPIAIVDLDFHQGDGNKITFANDASVLTYSVHGSVWAAVEAVADVEIRLSTGTDDATYLRALRRSLRFSLEQHGAKLVFYIAGNDVLGGDHLGDFALTTDGVLERDRYVTTVVRELGSPMVVTLGGGYSPLAWHCTANYLRWLLADSSRKSPRPLEDLRDRFAQIARTFTVSELREGDDLDIQLKDEDVYGELAGPRVERRILGYYSVHGIELALERYGLFQRLRGLGFHSLTTEIDPGDPQQQMIRIRGRRGSPISTPLLLLVELVLRRQTLKAPNRRNGAELDCIVVEWLLLQDPTAEFSLRRPRLPGQTSPGLGIAEEVQELLLRAALRVGADGIVSRPSHYHNAVVEAQAFSFLEPQKEGELRALEALLEHLSIADATWLVEQGGVRQEDGRRYRWEPGNHLLPVSARAKALFDDERYRRAVHASYDAWRDRLQLDPHALENVPPI